MPVVFRGPPGADTRLAAQHAQSLEALFANIPGLEVYAPSSPEGAKGLMAAAIRSDNPVVFLEHKLLDLGAAAVPEAAFPPRPRPHPAPGAGQLARDGIEAEVIDPRTIRPFDTATVLASVRRTNRALIVHEAPLFGGKIAAQIAEHAFDWLDAQVRQLGAPDMPVPTTTGWNAR